jgi:hypothetical protein
MLPEYPHIQVDMRRDGTHHPLVWLAQVRRAVQRAQVPNTDIERSLTDAIGGSTEEGLRPVQRRVTVVRAHRKGEPGRASEAGERRAVLARCAHHFARTGILGRAAPAGVPFLSESSPSLFLLTFRTAV